MADYSITVDGDFSGFLSQLKNADTAAQTSGQSIGKKLGDGVDAANTNIKALQAQIAALAQTRAKLSVDSTEYKATQATIDALHLQLTGLMGQKLKLQADTTEIKQAETSFDDLADAVNEGSNRFGMLDGVVAGIASTLSTVVVDAAGQAIAAVGNLVNSYAALDTEIRKAAGAAGEADGYDKLAGSINKVGIEAAGSTQDVAQLATELVRGGMTIDQANDSLGAIVRGAEATGTGFASMGEVVSASLKGFGLEASKAKDVVDALVQGANASATDVTGMGNAFKYAAPVARILGVDVQGLGTAIGLMANAGIDASEAGVTLRNGLSKLGQAAPQTGGKVKELSGQAKIAADTMKELGINIYNADGTLKPMNETILLLKGAFDKLAPAAKIRLASELFGGEDDGTKWLALLNQSETEINKMATAMGNSSGAADKARDAMQGFEMKMKQVQGTLESIGTAIGSVAAAALMPLVDAANQVLGVFAGMPPEAQKVVIAVGLVAGGVVVATAAFVAFKLALQTAVVQSAVTGFVSLATGIGTTLVGAVTSCVAVIPGLLTQIQVIAGLSTTVPALIGGLATAIGTTLRTAVLGAVSGFTNLVLALNAIKWGALAANIGSFLVAWGPIALAVGLATTAVTTWLSILEGSKQVQSDFADAQKKTKEGAEKLSVALNDVGNAAGNAKNGWQQFIDYANESLALGKLETEFSRLQAGFTGVQMAALRFYGTIKDNMMLTSEEGKRAADYTAELKSQVETINQLIPILKQRAAEAEKDGNPTLAQNLRERVGVLETELVVNKSLITAYEQKLPKQAANTAATQAQTKASEAQIKAEQELNRIIAEAPVRAYQEQIELGNQLVSLTQAIGAAEQSRFSVVRAGLEYELSKAQEREASEETIKLIKRQIDAQDAAALTARYAALQMEQQLQTALLGLSQQKALQESDLSVLQARVDLLNAERAIAQAKNADDKATAEATRNVQQAILGIQVQKREALLQTQPIEAAIAGIQRDNARSAMQAEAAAKGLQINADGSLTPMRSLALETGRIALIATDAKNQMGGYGAAATQAGTNISNAKIIAEELKDGTISIRQEWEDVTTKTSDATVEIAEYKRLAGLAGLEVGIAKDGTVALGKNWEDVNTEVDTLNKAIDGATGKTGNTKSGVDKIRDALKEALGPAADMVTAFTTAGDEAPEAVTAAEGFSGALNTAASAGTAIKNIKLDAYMGAVSTNTGNAATAAQNFYTWLEKAANLPSGRWTGGPVEAGGEYRINELGQEAFLSAGRLSMINASANSIWRAPADGVVIPAGITARLQSQGAVPVSGGGVGTADLAIEIGKLRQEVGNLARRDWSVHVQQRTGPTGSQVLRTLLR